MSFPRARITRFNDVQRDGPGVGSYNPQLPVHTPTAVFGLTPRTRGTLPAQSSLEVVTPDIFRAPRTTGNHTSSTAESLRRRITQVMHQLEDRDQLIDHLRKSKEILSVRVGQLESRLRALYKDVKQGTKDRQETSRKAEGVDKMKDAFDMPLESSTQEVNLTKDTSEIAADLESLMNEFCTGVACCEDYLNSPSPNMRNEEIASLKAEREEHQKQLHLLHDEVSLLKLDKKNITECQQVLQSAMTEWNSKVESSLTEQDVRMRHLNQERQQLNELLEEQKKKVIQYQESASGMVHTLKEMELQQKTTDETNLRLKLELQSQTEKLSKMHSALEHELAQTSELILMNNHLEEDIKQAVASKAVLEEKLKKMEESVLELEQHRDNLERSAAHVAQQAEALRNEMAQREMEKSELVQRLADTEHEKERLLSERDKALSQFQVALNKAEKISKAVVTLESDNEELKYKLTSIEQAMTDVAQEKVGLILTLEELQSEKGALEEKLEKSEVQVASLTLENSQLILKMEDEIAKTKSLDECFMEEQTKVALLESRLESGASALASMASLQKELKDTLGRVEEERDLCSIENTKLSAHIKELVSENKLLTCKLQNTEEVTALLQEEIDRARADRKAEEARKNEMEEARNSVAAEACELRVMVRQGAESVATLEACKERLEQKLVATEQQLAKALRDVSKFSADLETVENEKESLGRKLSEAELNAATYRSMNDELRLELEDAKESSGVLRKSLAQKDEEIADMSLELMQNAHEINEMKMLRLELEEQLQSANDAWRVLCKDMEELMGEVEVLRNENCFLSKMVSDSDRELVSMKEDVDKLSSDLITAEMRVCGLEAAKRSLEKQLTEQAVRIHQLEEEHGSLSKTVATLEEEAARQHEKLQENEDSLSALSEKNSLLSTDLKAQEVHGAALNHCITEQGIKIQQLQSELSQVTAAAEYKEKELQISLHEANKIMEELRLENGKLVDEERSILEDKQRVMGELQEALAELAALQVKLNETCEELHTEKDDREKLQAEVDYLRQSANLLETTLQQTSARLTVSEMQLVEQQGKLISAENMAALMKQEQEDTLVQLKAVQCEVNVAAQKLKESEQEASTLVSEKDSLISKLGAEQEHCSTLKSSLIEKDSQISKLESQLSDLFAEVATKEQSQNSMEQKLESLAAANEQLRSDNSEAVRQITTLQMTLQHAEVSADVEKTKRIELEESLNVSQSHVAMLESRLQNISNEASALEACRQGFLEQIASLQQQLAQAEEGHSRLCLETRVLKCSMEKLSSSNTENEHRAKKYSTVCRHLDKENRHLSAELETVEKTNEKWRHEYDLLKAKVGPFEDQLNMYAYEKQLLEEHNEETASELSEVLRKYTALLGHQNQRQRIHHIDKLCQQQVQMKKELLKLREQTHMQKTQISRLEIELTKATGKRRQLKQKEDIDPAL